LGQDNATGLFFDKQNVTAIVDAVNKFEKSIPDLHPVDCRNNALKFSAQRFKDEMGSYIESKWLEFQDVKKIVY
ncbi:TPA: glycosyltransferase family 4 protein, partial [Klebsiella pneumoniae]|nr:glycosyltransferase family 4 protein [Klebsiella pneumoniae]